MNASAVKRQAKAAEKMHEQVYGAAGVEPKTDEKPQEPIIPTEAEEKADGTMAAPAPDGDPEESATVVDIKADMAPKEDYEHKYRTLQGMYNAEVPKLQGSIREANLKIESMEQMIASMNAAPTPARTDDPAATPRSLTAEEIEDYGTDMIDVVKRAAREEFGPEMTRLKEENAQLKQNVSTVAASTAGDARTNLFDNLASAVPNWQVMNKDPDFLSWLGERDAYSGQTRQDMLLVAFENNDGPRVIAFFNGYSQDRNIVRNNEPAAEVIAPTVSLESLVAPGPASTATANQPGGNPTAGEGKIFSTAEVQAFYRDVQRGEFKNDPVGKDRTEKAIIKAGREGRIR
jgi:hypothetical protein